MTHVYKVKSMATGKTFQIVASEGHDGRPLDGIGLTVAELEQETRMHNRQTNGSLDTRYIIEGHSQA